MKRFILAAVVLLGTAAVVFAGPTKKKAPARKAPPAPHATVARPKAPPPVAKRPPAVPARRAVATTAAVKSAYRPAGTVCFANLDEIAQAIAGIAHGPDPILKEAVPAMLRKQAVRQLFGPMRPGAPGVAVCFVDPAVAARIAAVKRPSDADADRVKRWCMVYPAACDAASFQQRHPQAVPEPDGTFKLPAGGAVRRTFWVHFPAPGWVTLAPLPRMAPAAFATARPYLEMPLGRDLAVIRMDKVAARAVFGSDIFGGGVVRVALAPAGLEVRGDVKMGVPTRPNLPPTALSFAGVPANAPLFGATTEPDDIRTADVFAFADKRLSAFVCKSILALRGPTVSTYYLKPDPTLPASAPQQRLAQILPEAKGRPIANVMFCSLTQMLRVYLPKAAATQMPLESAKMQMGARLLRRARGDGVGFMGWRDGAGDHFLLRFSRDELWATAPIWSAVLF